MARQKMRARRYAPDNGKRPRRGDTDNDDMDEVMDVDDILRAFRANNRRRLRDDARIEDEMRTYF
ncbi:hypothetical protein KGQ71_01755 [Patescibacteria group bacterium]|nr:hypothetical protein [Patescibacteria group bacterium]